MALLATFGTGLRYVQKSSVVHRPSVAGYAGYFGPSLFLQGPACALMCPAATLYRNYFLPPVNTLDAVEAIVQNEAHKYWTVRNGYCLPLSAGRMGALGRRLHTEALLLSRVKNALKIGVHW